jgi:hypothetical protein
MTARGRIGDGAVLCGRLPALLVFLVLGCPGILLLLTALPAFGQTPSVGFERVDIPQRNGRSLPGAFWYPSTSRAAPMRVGLTEQVVAEGGVIKVARRLTFRSVHAGRWSR